MSTDFGLRLFDDGQVECSEPSFALRVRIVPREVSAPFSTANSVSAVYLLLDDARQVYYVGETNDVNGRHASHRRQYPWWNHAVYFHVEAFGVERLRKYLQDRLFDRVRALQAGVVLVTRLAGFKGTVPAQGETFWRQMCLCGRALRILPFIDDSLFSWVVPATGFVDQTRDGKNPDKPQPWNAHRLSVALANRAGKPGSAGYLYQVLRAFKERKAGAAWRPLLESAGIEFDPVTGLVSDWSKAKNPLP